MAPSSNSADCSRLHLRTWCARIMADCEDFGARFGYSPRLMVAGMAFAAVRLCETHTGSDRLQPFPPETKPPSPPHNRRRSDTARRSHLSSIQGNLLLAWISLRRLLARPDRLSS
ncbi:MAG: hypothetical protein NVSMB3_03760 [Acidobacteriaceae bacterium]